MRILTALMLAVLILTMLFGCAAPEPAVPADTATVQPSQPAAEPGIGEVVILFTGDIRGVWDGPLDFSVLSGLKKELEKTYGRGNVLLVDGGNALSVQGEAGEQERILALMNAAGYDLAVPGAGELAWGPEAWLTAAEFLPVSCNFYNITRGGRGDTVTQPYHMFETGSLRVAFVGVTAPDALPEGMDTCGISGAEEGILLQADVQANINAAMEGGADRVIALGNLTDQEPWTAQRTVASVTGLTAFLNAGAVSAETADRAGKPVPLLAPGGEFAGIGILILHENGDVQWDVIRCREVRQTFPDESGASAPENAEEKTETVGYELVCDLYTGPSWVEDETVAALGSAG